MVLSATSTHLTVTRRPPRSALVPYTMLFRSGFSSGAAVQVATVVPVVTSSTANLAANATTLTINGFGFSNTAADNTASFSGGVRGMVTATTAFTLTVSNLAGLTGGPLNSSVT